MTSTDDDRSIAAASTTAYQRRGLILGCVASVTGLIVSSFARVARDARRDLEKLADSGQDAIVSTRASADEDARRDFDHFDEDKELSHLREAMRRGQWRAAAELASNLDEHLSRGGSLPIAWLGPRCMQSREGHEHRLKEWTTRAALMSPQEHETTIWGFVEVLPDPPPRKLLADRLRRRRAGR